MKRQLGLAFCAILGQPDVVEMMLNPDGQVWVDRLGSGMSAIGNLSSDAAEMFIGTVASTLRGTVTREAPLLECSLPLAPPFNGARFAAMIPPVIQAPTFTIRLKASQVFTLLDYEQRGIMTARQRAIIERAVSQRLNIIVAGGTGTGKTTLTNAILAHIAEVHPKHRLVIIEDTGELQCPSFNKIVLLTSDQVDMQRLLKATMRMRPDRIIVGEVRDGAALALLMAWNTGHPGGVGTIHTNASPSAALVRMEQMVAMASQNPMQSVIAEAVDVVVFIAKAENPAGRLVRDVVAVRGYAAGAYQLENME